MPCDNAVDCSNLTQPIVITVLPDIVGIGILTSFMISAIIACSTVILGYWFDMLPGSLLSRVDLQVLERWRRCKPCAQRELASTVTPTPALRIAPCQHTDPKIAERRQEGLRVFLLALSDAQLVTGLAMMIAAYVQHCTLSCYEFQVVASLAWLSSTTHLATIQGLQQYFRENRALRDIRAAGMMCNLIMLMGTSFLNTAASSRQLNKSFSFQCIFNDFLEFVPFATVSINVVFIFIPLIIQYARGFAALYPLKEDLLQTITRRHCCVSFRGPRWSEDEFDEWYELAVQRSSENPDGEAMSQAMLFEAHMLKQQKHFFKSALACLYTAYLDCHRSFLPILHGLIYDLSYGVTSVITSRQDKPDVANSENAVDFGQIVPLFLLILPLASALEAYSDFKKKIGQLEIKPTYDKPTSWSNFLQHFSQFGRMARFNNLLATNCLELSPPDPNSTTSNDTSPPNDEADSNSHATLDDTETPSIDAILMLRLPGSPTFTLLKVVHLCYVLVNIAQGAAILTYIQLGIGLCALILCFESLIVFIRVKFFMKTYLAARKLGPSSTIDPYRRRAPPPSTADLTTRHVSETRPGQTSNAMSIISERTGSPEPMFDERDVTEAGPVLQGIRRRTTLRSDAEDYSSPLSPRRDTEARIGL